MSFLRTSSTAHSISTTRILLQNICQRLLVRRRLRFRCSCVMLIGIFHHHLNLFSNVGWLAVNFVILGEIVTRFRTQYSRLSRKLCMFLRASFCSVINRCSRYHNFLHLRKSWMSMSWPVYIESFIGRYTPCGPRC